MGRSLSSVGVSPWVQPIAASWAAGTAVVTTAYATVVGVLGTNRNAAVRYLQLHNRESLSASDVPTVSIPVPASSSVAIGSEFFGVDGMRFGTGLVFGWSTTAATYTAATAGEHDTQISGEVG